jgi:hypothetical protein
MRKGEKVLLITVPLTFSRFHCFTFSLFLSEAHSRPARLVAFLAQNAAPDFRLKRHVVVLAAMVADDFKPRRSAFAAHRFFRAAFLTALRVRQILAIKSFLLFFRKKKNVFALYARDFDIRHR